MISNKPSMETIIRYYQDLAEGKNPAMPDNSICIEWINYLQLKKAEAVEWIEISTPKHSILVSTSNPTNILVK